MIAENEIVRKSAIELRRLIVNKELSPVEVVEACLSQIEKYNGVINAVWTVNESALDEAHKAEQAIVNGDKLGILHGLPVGIKDVTETAGIRTTYGSPLYSTHIPKEDALVVQRLKQAGAIILGKTNTPEFATGGNTFNEVFGATRNPWNTKLSAGGSTGGGAAALSSGMITLAEGTDLGGSLRIPASFCGVVGLRPSPGLVPTEPTNYLWDSLSVTGGLARTADDLALMLQAVSGPGEQTPFCQPNKERDYISAVRKKSPNKLKVAYCRDIAGSGIEDELGQICRNASFELSQIGMEVDEIDFDLSFGRDAFLDLRGYRMVAQHFNRLDKLDELGENLRGNIRAALKITVEQLAASEQTRLKIQQKFESFFEDYDTLLTPCMVVSPFPVEQNYPETVAGKKMKTYVDWFAPTFLLSLTGLPVGCVPCGLTSEKLPVGLQIVGKPWSEESVLALAQRVQDLFPIGLPYL